MANESPKREAGGLAVAGIVLGLLGLTSSPVLLGLPLGMAGLIVALAHARQRPRRRVLLAWGLGLSLAAVLASGLLAAWYVRLFQAWRARTAVEHDTAAPAWVGQRVPELKLTTIEGQPLDVAALAGRPVVLNFWATWCGPCLREIPHLERLVREEPDVVVVGISDEDEATLHAFAARRPVGYPLVSLPFPPAPLAQIVSLPTTVYVDRNGVIHDVHVGEEPFAALRRRALAAPATGPGSASRP